MDTSRDILNPLKLTNAQGALDAFIAVLVKHGLTYTGGCRPFYTPAEWRARGEEFGRNSQFVIVHDGGDVAHALNTRSVREELAAALAAHGCYLEGATCWYTTVEAL